MEPLNELTQSINWNLAFKGSYNAGLNEWGGIVTPIGKISFNINGHALTVGMVNGTAKANWRLAAWCSICAPNINTGSTTVVTDDVEILRTSVLLGKRHLIKIPYYGIQPYKIILDIPRWHEAMLIEAWWYDDERYDPIQEMIKDVRAQL